MTMVGQLRLIYSHTSLYVSLSDLVASHASKIEGDIFLPTERIVTLISILCARTLCFSESIHDVSPGEYNFRKKNRIFQNQDTRIAKLKWRRKQYFSMVDRAGRNFEKKIYYDHLLFD